MRRDSLHRDNPAWDNMISHGGIRWTWEPGFYAMLGLSEKSGDIMRTVNKLDKIGPEKVKVILLEDCVAHMKAAVKKTYGLKGEKIVNMNIAAVDAGINAVKQVQVKESWKNLSGAAIQPAPADVPDIIKNILVPINAQKGDLLPVSAFKGMEDGTMPLGPDQAGRAGENLPEGLHGLRIPCCHPRHQRFLRSGAILLLPRYPEGPAVLRGKERSSPPLRPERPVPDSGRPGKAVRPRAGLHL